VTKQLNPAEIAQADSGVGEVLQSLYEEFLCQLARQSRKQREKQDALTKFGNGVRFPDEQGLKDLKNAPDAGFPIAELCYYLRFD
jgi:3-methyladenine DNA glycosylase AlkC